MCSIFKEIEAKKSLHLLNASVQIKRISFEVNKIIKAYKFRISKPSKTVQNVIEQTLNNCRFLYNSALQERKQAYQLNRISINYFDQANQLKDIKETCLEYTQIHSQVLQDVLKRVDKTFQSFFNRIKRKEKAGFPRFKSASRFDSFCFPQSGFALNGNKLTLSKIGTVKLKLSRNIVGKIKTLTIKKEIDKYFAVFTVETNTEPLPKTNQSVGIDAGLKTFLTLSDGTEIDNNRFLQRTQKKLRIAQRSVSRKVKGSNSRKKAVLKLRKIHQQITNQRNDFQHKVANFLVKTFDVICIEKLNLKGLNKGMLAKQFYDVAIGNIFNKLKSKAESAEKKVIEVNPSYTSQDCSACGSRVKKDLSVRIHHCLNCGLTLDRDLNASINIHRLGISHLDLTNAVGQSVFKESPTL